MENVLHIHLYGTLYLYSTISLDNLTCTSYSSSEASSNRLVDSIDTETACGLRHTEKMERAVDCEHESIHVDMENRIATCSRLNGLRKKNLHG